MVSLYKGAQSVTGWFFSAAALVRGDSVVARNECVHSHAVQRTIVVNEVLASGFIFHGRCEDAAICISVGLSVRLSE